MLSLFIPKKEKSYEKVARRAFSYHNEFRNICREITQNFEWNRIKDTLSELETHPETETTIKLYTGAEFTGRYSLFINQSSKTYIQNLQNVAAKLGKVQSIIEFSERGNADYLYSSLVDVVYLMVNIDDSLKKGVPLHYDTIQEAVSLIEVNLTERLDDYYRMSVAELKNEIDVAKDMRKTYEARRNALNTTTTKIETGA